MEIEDMSRLELCRLAQRIANELVRRDEEGINDSKIGIQDIDTKAVKYMTPGAIQYVQGELRNETERRAWHTEVLARQGKYNEIKQSDKFSLRSANIYLRRGYKLFSEIFEIPPQELVAFPGMTETCLKATYDMFRYLDFSYYNKWRIGDKELLAMLRQHRKERKEEWEALRQHK